MIDFIKEQAYWLTGDGKDSDIIISSRIRLARNLANRRFPHRSKERELKEVIDEVTAACKNVEAFKESTLYKLSEIDELRRHALMERHLISREHLNTKLPACIITKGEKIALMINEEDHLRLQVFTSGLEVKECWEFTNHVDDGLSSNLEYAHSPEFGYLTACPTNLGTGLRASVLAHLPALCISKSIGKLFNEVVKLGISIRGLYGEGTESKGELFQLSNQLTLGRSEQEFVDSVERITHQIISYERQARESLRKDIKIQDKIMRAWGTLLYAKLLSTNETLKLLSLVRLGINLDMIKDVNYNLVNRLLILIQPAHVQLYGKSKLEPDVRDKVRVELIHKILQGCL